MSSYDCDYQENYRVLEAKAYDEVIDFIAAGSSPRSIADFRPSDATKARVAELVQQEKVGTLSPDEKSELEDYLRLEHIMRLAKARAVQYLASK